MTMMISAPPLNWGKIFFGRVVSSYIEAALYESSVKFDLIVQVNLYVYTPTYMNSF